MLMNYSDAMSIYKSDYKLKKALKNKEIFKISKGIYSDKSLVNELVLICKKFPNIIITLDSAFYYYNLTDVIPQKIYIVSVRDSYKIKDLSISQSYQPKDIVEKGKISINTEEGVINIYNRERLLVELIRKRNLIPLDYYKEIINNYRIIKDELDMCQIEEYGMLFKSADKIFEIIQKEVF